MQVNKPKLTIIVPIPKIEYNNIKTPEILKTPSPLPSKYFSVSDKKKELDFLQFYIDTPSPSQVYLPDSDSE